MAYRMVFWGKYTGKQEYKENNGGGGEIRTLERLPVDGFKTVAFSHSATPPQRAEL